MSKKRKRPSNNPARPPKRWTPFERTYPVDPSKERIEAMEKTFSAEDMKAFYEERDGYKTGKVKMWQNSMYVVIAKEIGSDGMQWLSIRSNDRSPIRDWRHFQRIKNEISGPEREAIELFPAESRLVDEANQYHLWVLPEGERVPVGFNRRLVGDSDTAAMMGAVQRDLDVE